MVLGGGRDLGVFDRDRLSIHDLRSFVPCELCRMSATSSPARGNLGVSVRRYGIVVTLFVLLVVLGVASPHFFRLTNFANILAQWAPVGIMSVGTTYVILAGGFDLSVAAAFAFLARSSLLRWRTPACLQALRFLPPSPPASRSAWSMHCLS